LDIVKITPSNLKHRLDVCGRVFPAVELQYIL
jgi:hypothetical protein